MSEDHPTEPTNPYGASKLAGEKYCTSFAKAYGMDITCLRYFSVYGPRGRPDQILYSFAQKVARGEPPVIYGDGSYSRDFTYISDIVSATFLALLRDLDQERVLNIGYGKDFKVLDVARRIIDHYDGHVEPIFRDGYGGDFRRTLCNNELARNVLGWRPSVKFDEGLSYFLDWFDLNRVSHSTETAQMPPSSTSTNRGL
jgi:UDP-glucose 4-epimerase